MDLREIRFCFDLGDGFSTEEIGNMQDLDFFEGEGQGVSYLAEIVCHYLMCCSTLSKLYILFPIPCCRR